MQSLFAAYAAGSFLWIAGLLAEAALLGSKIQPGTIVAYSLLGGATALAARTALGFVTPRHQAGAATLLAIVGLAELYLLYFVNVRVLPGDPYYSAISLIADLAVSLPLLGAVILLLNAGPVRRARQNWRPQLATLGLELAAAGCIGLALSWPSHALDPQREGNGPNLLLIVLDSARGDHVGAYGYSWPTSPEIDSLASRGRLYERAYAGSSWTVPSVIKMLTGRVELPAGGMPSLPERLVGAGYVTAFFTDNPHLGRGSALARGFDRAERSVGEWRRLLGGTILGEVIERLDPGNDRSLVDRAIAWGERTRGPLFLYAQLMDSHTPYTHSPIDGRKRNVRRIEFPMPGMKLSSAEAEDVIARYDGGIRSADQEVGRLVAAASRLGRPFLAIVTADHGESLGEDGRWFHGGSLAPELLAIPMIVFGDGVVSGRVPGPVGHASVMKTLLAAAGIDCDQCSGVDLRSADAQTVIEGGLPPDFAFRVVKNHKLVLDVRTRTRQLFDLLADPMERRNLASIEPDRADLLSAGLSVSGEPPQSVPEGVDRLKALGYVSR